AGPSGLTVRFIHSFGTLQELVPANAYACGNLEGMGDTPKPPKYGGPERRERFRLKQETKILVKAGSRSEVGTIINLTRTGVFFSAFGDYERGTMVEVLFPYDPGKPPKERPIHGEVVRVQDMEGSMKKGVAVKMLGIFLKP
ncbi:MAG: PilZ domain-containing protein, partial [Gammaproteobacteria bacterium]